MSPYSISSLNRQKSISNFNFSILRFSKDKIILEEVKTISYIRGYNYIRNLFRVFNIFGGFEYTFKYYKKSFFIVIIVFENCLVFRIVVWFLGVRIVRNNIRPLISYIESPLANLHLFPISIASQPSRPDARPSARGRCQPFLHYVERFPIFPNPFYSATASTLVTNRT